MTKKLFSVVLLASLFASASSVFASQVPTKVDVKVVAEVKKPSVAARAAHAVTTTASNVTRTVKSAANEAATTASNAAAKTASATSAFIVAAYNVAWNQNRTVTCASIAAITAFLLYNYNDTVKASVRGFFGLDEEACRFCPETCHCELN